MRGPASRCGHAALLALIAAGCGEPSTDPSERDAPLPPHEQTVDTESGELVGSCKRGVCAYLGMPYAAAPLGNRRFRAPTAYASDHTVHANAFGAPCLQLDTERPSTTLGSEDCLTLNLWIPEQTAEPPPVLVFFHGGGNVRDSASNPQYDGARLAERAQIAVVTVEFRLGALGYLAHPALGVDSPAGAAGNYGLLDQEAALDWLYEHLPAFHAARRMTLVGQSAGARNICALIGSPAGQRPGVAGAILQSGACNARTREESAAHAHNVALSLGCDLAPDPAACLRQVSADALTTALPSLPDPMTTSAYNVTLDGWLLDEPPLTALSQGRAQRLRLLIGTNAEEVAHALPTVTTDSDLLNRYQSYFGPDLADRIATAYPASDYDSPQAALVAAITDARYTCAARRSLRAAVTMPDSEVYRYRFAHRPEHAPYHELGAIHGIELMYAFHNYEAWDYAPGPRDEALAEQLTTLYGDFVYGRELRSPAGNGQPAGPWPRYARDTEAYRTLGQEEHPDRSATHCDFWDALEPAGTVPP